MKNKGVKGFLLVGLLTLCCAVLTPVQGFAAVVNPNYQVFVANQAGTPVVDPISISVSFYDAAVGGTAVWSEAQTVTPDSGLCVVNLGATTPFTLDLSRPYYLGVSVAGAGELATRLSVPGMGAFSRAGDRANLQNFNVKYEWLNLE
jgi:hypothetical protein